jgi:ElaB/YqjD/DUF883 family membrane-anchored ribosome-binding protein
MVDFGPKMETLTVLNTPRQRMSMEGSADKLLRDVRVVVQNAEDLIKSTAGDIEEKTREARANLAGALVVAKDSLNQAEETAAEGVRAADAWVRSYPYPSLAVAFVVGLVVGALAARR